MIYHFSRTQAEWSDVALIKQVSDSAKYIVLMEDGVTCGEFLYNKKRCFIVNGHKRIRFDIKRPWFGDDTVNITDDTTNDVIGSFQKHTHWLKTDAWEGFSLYNKYFRMTSGNSGIDASISSWTNHNHLKYSLANATDEFIYTFKLDLPVFSWGNRMEKCKIEGTIQSDADELTPLFAGFFLIEEMIRELDKPT